MNKCKLHYAINAMSRTGSFKHSSVLFMWITGEGKIRNVERVSKRGFMYY